MENPTNPLHLIERDHKKVQEMLDKYQGMNFEDKKEQANKICLNLAVHMEMEEELFYPKLENISNAAADLADEARDDHNEAKNHIKMIQEAETEEDLNRHIQMLQEIILEHIQEEEQQIFPIAEKNLKNDFTSLSAQMMAFKTKEKGQAILEKIKAMF